MLYYEQWRRVAEEGASYYDVWIKDHPLTRLEPSGYSNHRCSLCGLVTRGNQLDHGHITPMLLRILQKLAGLQCLISLDDTFTICLSCEKPDFSSWRRSIEENIKNIQPFNAPPVSFVNSATPRYVVDVFQVHHKFSQSSSCSPVIRQNEFSDQFVSALCKCWDSLEKDPLSLAAHCSLCT